MDRQFENAYYSLLERRINDERYRVLASFFQNACEKMNFRARPDATLFVTSNFFEIVVLPLELVAQENSLPEGVPRDFPDQFRQYYQSDLQMIAQEACDIAAEHGAAEVSSSSVLEAVARVLHDLSIDQMKIWGRKDQR